jgi:hypothetical protein
MESILEIREGCVTPVQLIKSLPFSRFLERYKKDYIADLGQRDARHQSEWRHRSDYVRQVSARDFLDLLEAESVPVGDELDRARELALFFDGGFHHFRTRSYSRLVRLQNEVVTDALTPEAVKDRVTEKARGLSGLLLETRRAIMDRVGLEEGTRHTPGLKAYPNVTAGEISGHYFALPSDYMALSHVPLTISADIQTGIDYTTPSNKRALPFYELDHNPLDMARFKPETWVAVPLNVGGWLIVAYVHKSRGCIEMEPGLLNLFPFADADVIRNGRRPDGIFLFGDPDAADADLGYWWDAKNQVLIGMVPNRDELKYFGYCKKPILTLHNVLAIRAGDIPLHCGCTRYRVRFEAETGAPYIAEMRVKADDMGRIRLEKGEDGISRPIFYGTETGAFACLDGFSERAKMQMQGREVGYNRQTGSNARQIVPVAADTEVFTGHQLDVLLYANNFSLKAKGEATVNTDMAVMDAIDHFRRGERVAAGSTQTHRGARESSYWANPFPLLRDPDGTVLHPELYNLFQETEERFIRSFEKLVARGEMKLGVAHSELMAGAAADNNDAAMAAAGFVSREEVEMRGPERLAQDLIDLIKRVAADKRARLGGEKSSVSVTVAIVGDSRTGKSETAEKMEGILDLNLV